MFTFYLNKNKDSAYLVYFEAIVDKNYEYTTDINKQY